MTTTTRFGTLTLNSNGSFIYQPNLNFASTNSFTYVANNGTHNSNEATVTLTVNPINDEPIISDDLYFVSEYSPLLVAIPRVLENDSDVSADSLYVIFALDDVYYPGYPIDILYLISYVFYAFGMHSPIKLFANPIKQNLILISIYTLF